MMLETGGLNVRVLEMTYRRGRFGFRRATLKKLNANLKQRVKKRNAVVLFEVDKDATPLAPARDVAERKQQQELLSKREQEFRALVENSPDTIARFDRECHRTYVNPAFERLHGQPADKVLGKNPSVSTPIPDELSLAFEKRLREVLRTGEEFTLETPFVDAAGNHGFGHVRIVPEFDVAGDVASIIVIGRDITREKETENEQRRLNRASRMLSGCNMLLINTDDEKQLLKDICRLVVETGGYENAWVGYRQDDKDGTVLPMAHFGLPKDFPPVIKVSWKENEWGRGMIGSAIRTGKSVLNRDYENNPALLPWREMARKLGVYSGISLPLKNAGGGFGTLNIHSRQPKAFGEEKIHLLEELSGNITLGIGMLRLRRERALIEAQLRSQEQAFRALAENSPDTIARYDRDCRRIYVNQAFSILTGIPIDVLLGKKPSDYNPLPEASAYEIMLKEVFASGEMREIEYTWPNAEGNPIISHLRIVPEYDENGAVASVLATGRDITRLKKSQEQIEYMARHDILTGLPNRQSVRDLTDHAIADARRYDKKVALLFVDLDNFKTVNDSLGHAVGDRLLQEASRRLQSCVRETDTVGRHGGDEFVITLCDVEQVDGVLQVILRLFQELERPILLEGDTLSVSMSIGVALYPDDGNAFDELLKKADAAMYQAKNAGRNTCRFASEHLRSAMPESRFKQATCNESP